MVTATMKQMTIDNFDRLLSITIGISALLHVVVLVLGLVVPPLFASPPPPTDVIQIEMLVKDLPKGPNIGTQAPTKTQTAARAPDHTLPWKKKPEKVTGGMAMKKKAPKVKSKRLNYKERRRSSAIDRIKKLKEAKAGGGGESKKSGGNVFAVYLARVQRRMQAAWKLPPGLSAEDRAHKVYCRIKVGANGAIISSYVIQSSGLPHLDRSAMAAISAVGTVPPPPPLIAKELAEKGMRIAFDPLTK